MSSSHADPAGVIQRQIDAYNAKDIDALMALYAPEADMYEHPSTLLCRGIAQHRSRFLERFKEPNLHAVVKHRTVLGSIVIDHEIVNRTFPEGPGTIEVVILYEVKDGKITRAWMVPGIKTLDSAK